MSAPLSFRAVLPHRIVFASVGLADKLNIPPPVFAVLPEKVQFTTVGLEEL
jgi:hypothetical protein